MKAKLGISIHSVPNPENNGISKSFTSSYIVCFEDRRKLISFVVKEPFGTFRKRLVLLLKKYNNIFDRCSTYVRVNWRSHDFNSTVTIRTVSPSSGEEAWFFNVHKCTCTWMCACPLSQFPQSASP